MEEQEKQGKTAGIYGRRNEALYYLNFIVWPFGVLLAALRNKNRPWSKNVFWIFCIFFGYNFIIPEEGPTSPDCIRYAQMLVEYAHSDMNLKELWNSFYSDSSGYVDIFQPLITFLVSRITDNPSTLFALYALIFGYFYSRNLWYILDRVTSNITVIIFIYILTFALLNPIWNINGFRMWTAAQMFLFGTLPFLMENKSSKLIWAFFSVFVHFSFLYAVATLLLFILLRNKLNIYFGLFIITSFIKEINLQWVQSTLSVLPGMFQSRIESYANTEYAEGVNNLNQTLNWYVPFSSTGIKWVTYALTLSIYFFWRKFLKDKQDLMTLFCYSLLLYSFANIFSLVPSGHRFITIANTFIFPFFIIFISTSPKLRGLLLVNKLSIPLLLLFCAITIRIGMDFFGFMTLCGNPLLATLYKDTFPLITGIKMLF